MNRREALTATATLLGTAVIGSHFFLNGCSPARRGEARVLLPEDISLLDEVGETILPTTPNSPGAKAAKIGDFMKVMVRDCYTEAEQKIFSDGLISLKEFSKKKGGKEFQELTDAGRKSLLTTLDQEAAAWQSSRKAGEPEHYFSMIKQLTIWGYFSSEPGATQALRYVPIPGRFDGCIDYHAGEGAWVY